MELEQNLIPTLPDRVRPFTLAAGWICTTRGAGMIESKGAADLIPEPYKEVAVALVKRLNREIRLGGQWVVGWTDVDLKCGIPMRMTMSWIDADGDMPFLVDSEDSLFAIFHGQDSLIEQCLDAYRQWRDFEADVGIKPEHKIKAAQGERSADEDSCPDTLLWD